VRSHSSTATQTPTAGFGSCCMNIDVVRFTFSGAPAHQLQAWDGRDALTGVIELFNHIDAIRRTLRPETRIQGIVTEGGKAPNVVPDRAAAEFWLRYPDPVYLAQVLARVSDAARAAALATGTKVPIGAEAMAALLYHFATDAPYRATVQREFGGLRGLYADYLAALRQAYPVPKVPEPAGK